jgi:SAM-dependent methyltransferase
MANQAAERLGLNNATFYRGDARELSLHDQFDAVMMIDLLHHIDDSSKHKLLATCTDHLAKDGRLIIKDVTTHPFLKIGFTWALDVLMTSGLDMWYWNEKKFHKALGTHFDRVDTFPITDSLPYPQVLYL